MSEETHTKPNAARKPGEHQAAETEFSIPQTHDPDPELPHRETAKILFDDKVQTKVDDEPKTNVKGLTGG